MYIKLFFTASCFAIVTLTLPALAKRLTYGFRVAKLQIEEPFQKEWQTTMPKAVHDIVSQEFYFLGRGAQCYVFKSKDEQYVIKLFRSDHGSVRPLFRACILALEQAQEETGLLYLHLNKTENQLPELCLRDALCRKITLPLDHYRFAIQKKATDFQKALHEAASEPERMEQRIDQLLNLLVNRASKQITNTDSNLFRNSGFLENGALEIDFGNYLWDPALARDAEILRYTQKLRKWLAKEAPGFVDYLDNKVRIVCESSLP